MTKHVLTTLFVCLISISSFAQKIEINGTVTEKNSKIPIPGVNILIKGINKGTSTNFDGEFKLQVPSNATLIISSLGYKTKEVNVNGITILNITLDTETSILDEIVVVGYGTQTKKDVTGSIVTVKAEAIQERSVTNVSNALQGAVAGVVVTRSTSDPGGGNTIRIRGNTTLQGSNSPLVLIDDVPGNINDVTPNQVESISVLKDGAAAAIYGSRAAAGVIVITTKRAKAGVFSFKYSGDYIVNTPTKEREYVGALQYMLMDNEKAWNDNGNQGTLFPTWDEDVINKYRTGEAALDRDKYPDTDWAGLIIRKFSSGYRHNINIAGGSEKVKTNIFLGYEYQDALYEFRDWSRFNTRINNDIKITDKFSAVADINFALTRSNNPITNPIGVALQAGPVYPALWSDGRYAEGKSGNNILARLNEGGFSEGESYLFTGRFGLRYKLFDGLKISANITPTTTFTRNKTFAKEVRYWDVDDPDRLGDGNPIEGQANTRLSEGRSQFRALLLQGLINYDKTFGKHKVDALLGSEGRGSKTESLNVRGENFLSSDFPYLSQAPTAEVFDSGSGASEQAYASVFGRVNYNFDNKYYLGVAVRYDGSSRFGADYRWGTFPSVSAAWTVSNEEFMKPLKPALSFLKLKGSYGSLGNDRLGNYLYLVELQIQNALLANGNNIEEVRALSQLRLATPDIHWETTYTKNFGIELGFLDNRLNLNGEYFIKDTRDMLLNKSVPDLVGFEDPLVNAASMTTKGFDISASWRDTVDDDFNYSVSVNLSDAKSIVGSIDGKRIFSGVTISEEGQEFRALYGLQSEGLFKTQEEVDNSPVTNNSVRPGDVKYKDLSGPDGKPDGVINNFDRTYLGSSGPRYTYGGRVTASYKGFDLGVVFQGVGQRNFYLAQNYIRPFLSSGWYNSSREYASSYWSVNNTPEENLQVKYPRLSETAAGNNYRFSDYWLRDGSYLRIKTISLGYTLPNDVATKVGMSKLRLSLTANDFFTFDNLPRGVDPEQASGTGYFLTKSMVFGLQANF